MGPDLTVCTEFLGIGWRGIEEKKLELSKLEALSREFESLYGKGSVERGVEVLAEMAAPEIVRNGDWDLCM